MILSIVTDPNQILRKKSAIISSDEINSDNIQALIFDMAETMDERDGVGLAAPQVGQSVRLIVINAKNGPIPMISPAIIKKSWTKEQDTEGCLSLPGVYGNVKRHKKITCQYLDKDGNKKKLIAEGLMARVIQHEIDHLDGILFIDKAKKIEEYEIL